MRNNGYIKIMLLVNKNLTQTQVKDDLSFLF